MDVRDDNLGKRKNPAYWTYFLRQCFPCSMIVFMFFICGLYQGAPTVIIPQLRREANSTNAVSTEIESWLSSISSYFAIPWAIILPILGYRFGRKTLLILVSFNALVGNSIFYFSTNLTELLISHAIQGMLNASIMSASIMVLSEYTSPKHRGFILAVKSATFFWGIWVSNTIGTFFHWKNISIVAFICGIYNLSSIFCCESPYWLATKGRFDECATIHRWLKGTDEDAEEELRKLILSQKEHLNKKVALGRDKDSKIIKIKHVILCRTFYKPFIISTFSVCMYNFSGKVAYTVYAIDIIKKITSSEETAYNGMLILDGVTLIGMYLGCALTKFVKRRTQLLVFSSIGVGFLYILSIYLYMVKLHVILENTYVSLFLLTAFSMSIGCGPMILGSCCSAELTPLRYRSYFLCCLAIMTNALFGTILKVTPSIFKYCGTHGAFLFYGVSANVFILLLYKYLPETKDKTIQEVQCIMSGDVYFKTTSTNKSEFSSLEAQKINEETKELLKNNCINSYEHKP